MRLWLSNGGPQGEWRCIEIKRLDEESTGAIRGPGCATWRRACRRHHPLRRRRTCEIAQSRVDPEPRHPIPGDRGTQCLGGQADLSMIADMISQEGVAEAYAVMGCDVALIDHALLAGIRSDRGRRRVHVTSATQATVLRCPSSPKHASLGRRNRSASESSERHLQNRQSTLMRHAQVRNDTCAASVRSEARSAARMYPAAMARSRSLE